MIPKRIFQIAIGQVYISRLPLSRLKETLLNLNPGFEYVFLDDIKCLEFLETHFPQFISVFSTFSRPQYKSDFIRYLYAYTFGGFYVDIDLLPTISFSSLLTECGEPSAFFTLGAHKNPAGQYNELANGFFGTEPQNPFFLHLIQLMIQEPNPPDYGMNVKRIFRELSKLHSMTPFSLENRIFLVQEIAPVNSSYNIYSSPTHHICYSNGSGYPFSLPK